MTVIFIALDHYPYRISKVPEQTAVSKEKMVDRTRPALIRFAKIGS